ncbi:MAG: hypothetical protein ABR906_04230 [Terracidiphilus sp.]|jgi:hypothetical protein
MTINNEELELKNRLSLIEAMIAEGRRTTESWGKIFVVWGLAFFVAFAWFAVGHSSWAWPITMIATYALTRVINARWRAGQPRTSMGRSIGSIWKAMAISMFILFPAIGISGKTVDPSILTAVVATMLGISTAASSIILKWKLQFGCALIWWAVAVVSCFGTISQSMIAFLIANFFCHIVFGVYGFICDARRKRQEAIHA